MINEAMWFLKDWKWYLAAAAVFILMGILALVMIAALVGITLFAATSSGSDKPSVTSGKNNQQSRRSEPAGSLAPELVGTWYTSAGGGETDYTGKSRYRSNRRQIYRIGADGTIEYTFERETLTIMQCEVKERKIAGGTAATEGDTLVINLTDVTSLSSDSCESGDPVERNLPDETVRLKWRFKEEPETTRLCFEEADGEVCYERKD